MKVRWFAVTFLTLWVSAMFAAAFGPRLLGYWNAPDPSEAVIVPITVKPVLIPKPPETVVEKAQERVETPQIRPAVVDECPATASTPVTLPVSSKPKPKLRRLVKKAPPAPVLVGGQPQ